MLGVVERIWRYPIKSTAGERVDEVAVTSRGLAGDRLFAVRDTDGRFGSGKNTRRFRRMDGLLELRSRLVNGHAELLDPDGRPVPIEYLHHHLGRVDVTIAREGDVSHFDQLPVSLLTTATLDWVRAAVVPGVPVDERRFRPNILLRTPPGTPAFVEDGWFGATGRIGGELELRFERSSERCVMVNLAQGDLPHSADVLQAVARGHGNRLDVLATVTTPGVLRVGDVVRIR